MRPGTFQRGRQMGAGVTAPGLRAAVGTDRSCRLTNLILSVRGPCIPSTAAGAKSENHVSLADARGARWAPAAVPAASPLCPSRALPGAAGTCRAAG